MKLLSTSGKYAVKISKNGDSFLAQHLCNLTDDIHVGGQVTESRSYATEKAAIRWANGKLA